jgi:hypothetical protein
MLNTIAGLSNRIIELFDTLDHCSFDATGSNHSCESQSRHDCPNAARFALVGRGRCG